VRVRLVRVATVDRPIAMAIRANDNALYIASRGGRVFALRNGALTMVLDISALVTTDGERGLLGITFSTDGTKLYVDHTDTSGDIRIAEYTMAGGKAVSRRQLLFVDHPAASNHNGGDIHVGPDGLLYVAVGDGGSTPHNAQNTGNLLGKLLRINPHQNGSRAYTIPAGNPFVGRGGADEIWDWGLRNPWRFSFDRSTHDLWIADVGQSSREEIDLEPPHSGGRNYGWPAVEGSLVHSPPPSGAVGPLYEYTHAGGNCAITGGYVYRGSAIPDLRGAYLWADLCGGRVNALRQSGGRVVEVAGLGISTSRPVSFGQSRSGELYLLSLNGGVLRIAPA